MWQKAFVVVACLLAAGLFTLGIVTVITHGNDSTTSSSSAPGRLDACYMSHEFAKRDLKAPATARFQDCSQVSITSAPPANPSKDGSGTIWTVSGYVDSQNGFGALLRSTYSVVMTYQGGKEWKPQSIQVGGQ